jgi:hypothetical protein
VDGEDHTGVGACTLVQGEAVIRDDFDQLDIDSPIPYELTEQGRIDLAEALFEDRCRDCRHDWHMDSCGELYCVICGDVRTLVRGRSIQSHLRVKERR